MAVNFIPFCRAIISEETGVHYAGKRSHCFQWSNKRLNVNFCSRFKLQADLNNRSLRLSFEFCYSTFWALNRNNIFFLGIVVCFCGLFPFAFLHQWDASVSGKQFKSNIIILCLSPLKWYSNHEQVILGGVYRIIHYPHRNHHHHRHCPLYHMRQRPWLIIIDCLKIYFTVFRWILHIFRNF